jgi:methylation protein EvaC
MLNYCNVGADLIEFISDTTPIKQGKFSPGVHIPVRPYEDFKIKYPETALLLAWNHRSEILDKETDFMKTGGQWIVYVPTVEKIGK